MTFDEIEREIALARRVVNEFWGTPLLYTKSELVGRIERLIGALEAANDRAAEEYSAGWRDGFTDGHQEASANLDAAREAEYEDGWRAGFDAAKEEADIGEQLATEYARGWNAGFAAGLEDASNAASNAVRRLAERLGA